MRKLLFLILTGALGATLFAGVASAASIDLDGDRLWAKGSGVAYLGGGGVSRLTTSATAKFSSIPIVPIP